MNASLRRTERICCARETGARLVDRAAFFMSQPPTEEEVASDRLSDLVATPVDPNTSKGTFSAIINMGMPMRLRQWLSGVNKLLLQ
jgi:hypothetical protein